MLPGKKIKIPHVLQELHGEEATIASLVTVYLVSLLFTTLIYVHYQNIYSGWREILLLIVSLDISGGVIANFTEGTLKYYAERPKLRWYFIFLHILHPLVLWYIFDYNTSVLLIGCGILASCVILNLLSGWPGKKYLASAFCLIMITIIFVAEQPSLSSLLLTLFTVKLLPGFSAGWELKEINNEH